MVGVVRLTLQSDAVTAWAARVLRPVERLPKAWGCARLVEHDAARLTNGVTVSVATFDIEAEAATARTLIDRAWITLSARVPDGARLVMEHAGPTLVQLAT